MRGEMEGKSLETAHLESILAKSIYPDIEDVEEEGRSEQVQSQTQ